MFSCTEWVGDAEQLSAAASDKLGEVVGEEEFSGTAVEGVRRETKGLWGSTEGGGRHDSLLDLGTWWGAGTHCLLLTVEVRGGVPSPVLCHLLALCWLRGLSILQTASWGLTRQTPNLGQLSLPEGQEHTAEGADPEARARVDL